MNAAIENQSEPQRQKRWKPKLPIILALLTIIGGVSVFILVTDEVVELHTLKVDHAILKAMRTKENPSDPWGPAWLEKIAKDLTTLGNVAPMCLIILSVVTYLLLNHKWESAGLILFSVIVGVGLIHFIKNYVDRARPDIVPHLVEVSSKSFPSGHAAISAMVYLTLGALLAESNPHRRVKVYVMTLAILLTLMIGTTRIYLGVHFPSDVLAGWALGFAWAATAWLGARVIHHRKALGEKSCK